MIIVAERILRRYPDISVPIIPLMLMPEADYVADLVKDTVHAAGFAEPNLLFAAFSCPH